MKKTIQMQIEYVGHEKGVLTNKNGDTFTFNPNTSNGEELGDFLCGAKVLPEIKLYEYEFRAMSPSGGYVTGIIEADSRSEAKKSLLKWYSRIVWMSGRS